MKKLAPTTPSTMTTFESALNDYKEACDRYGAESEQASAAFTRAMMNAPQEFLELAGQVAQDMGLMPEPSGCDSEGNALYSLEELAERLEVPLEDALQALEAMDELAQGEGAPSMMYAAGAVYRYQ